VATQEGSNQTYAAQVRTQEGRVEIITELKDMVKALLDQWIAKSKSKPENMIFFRDGVSEGQYATVVEYEITAIKAACREIDPRYNPKVIPSSSSSFPFLPSSSQCFFHYATIPLNTTNLAIIHLPPFTLLYPTTFQILPPLRLLSSDLSPSTSFLRHSSKEHPIASSLSNTSSADYRFFTAAPNDADKSGNLPAGTVIDTDVVHPYVWDFYLRKHSQIQ
ncbi:hypothetical protein P7C70_g546, partial [Phenoliferia sp. Uapishka_3]